MIYLIVEDKRGIELFRGMVKDYRCIWDVRHLVGADSMFYEDESLRDELTLGEIADMYNLNTIILRGEADAD